MEEENLSEKKGKLWLWIILIVIIVAALAAATLVFWKNNTGEPELTQEETKTEAKKEAPAQAKAWSDGQVAIAGNYADAEVVDLGDGRYRMYYSIEPEVAGNKLEMYSAISTDGIAWTKEEGDRKTYATFPDAVKLPDGPSTGLGQAQWRIYFQNAGVIKSAVSVDGLKLADEAGARIDSTESGFEIENVGAPSTTRLSDGSYIMVYRGLINQPYSTAKKLPNQTTSLFFYATSVDGLTWQKKGLALDSRNETLLGSIDGAEWIKWDGSTSLTTGGDELRLYFWSYTGVYYSIYKDGTFSKATLDLPATKDKNIQFAPNPPGDPTLMKISGKWFMYYGQHEKGIYYSTLK